MLFFAPQKAASKILINNNKIIAKLLTFVWLQVQILPGPPFNSNSLRSFASAAQIST